MIGHAESSPVRPTRFNPFGPHWHSRRFCELVLTLWYVICPHLPFEFVIAHYHTTVAKFRIGTVLDLSFSLLQGNTWALYCASMNGPKSLDPAHSIPSAFPVRHFYLEFGLNLNSRTVVQYGKTRGFGSF